VCRGSRRRGLRTPIHMLTARDSILETLMRHAGQVLSRMRISRAVIERQGGSISVESADGGARFSIRLPLAG
jgi:hypothetical protein